MLRHLVRHLTAFDLRTFHNRGANYPDALLLDALLKSYLKLIAQHVGQFQDQSDEARKTLAEKRRRRSLRQAWIVRRHYEGLKVPASPTSPGDLQRVLPSEYAAAGEEEVLNPGKRRKSLFADDPLEGYLTAAARTVLERSLDDLDRPAELRELGRATFLDRPLGIAKRPGEIDRTPLLTYEAFSRDIARQRIAALFQGKLIREGRRDELIEKLKALPSGGYTGHHGRRRARPGTPCLEDANLAAPDVTYLRTTRASLDDFLGHFDWQAVREALPREYDWLTQAADVLLIRVAAALPESGQPLLAAFDATGKERWSLCLPRTRSSIDYFEQDGREYPAAGLVLSLTSSAAGETAAATASAIPVPAAAEASSPAA
jgi:hypothetical protein